MERGLREPGPLETSTIFPEVLHVLYAAFDEAWSEIAHRYVGDDEVAERARRRLAHAVLIVARHDSNDVERVKNGALQIMALDCRYTPMTATHENAEGELPDGRACALRHH